MYALKTVKCWYELTTAKLVKIETIISVRQTSKDSYSSSMEKTAEFLCLSFPLTHFYSNHLKCWKAKSNITQF